MKPLTVFHAQRIRDAAQVARERLAAKVKSRSVPWQWLADLATAVEQNLDQATDVPSSFAKVHEP